MVKSWEEAEKEFERILERIHGKKNVFIHRVTDSKEIRRAAGNKILVKKTPADYIVTAQGTMFYAEVKYCSNRTSFPLSALTTGQHVAIKRQNAAGGIYLVFIYNSNDKTWYTLSGGEIENLLDANKKSIKWKDLLKWLNSTQT